MNKDVIKLLKEIKQELQTLNKSNRKKDVENFEKPIKPLRDKYLSWGKYHGGKKFSGWTPLHASKVEKGVDEWIAKLQLTYVSDIKLSDFESELDKMYDNLAPKTIKATGTYLTAFLNWMISKEHIEKKENPLRLYKPGKARPKTKYGHFSIAEYTHMRKFMHEDYRLLCDVAVWSGYRSKELNSLTVAELIEVDGSCWLNLDAEDNKNGEEAWTPIPKWLGEELKERIKKLNLKPDDGLLKRWRNHVQILNNVMKRAGIQKKVGKRRVRVFHSLRDSFCTWLGEAGVDTKTIMEMSRHKSIDVLANRYLQTTNKRKLDAMKALESRFN